MIPISLVHKKDLDIGNGDTPTILYGYGSYGYSMDPGFHQQILPYLVRGMVFAIAHVRGGGEMGRQWYKLHGKYLNKRNTFSDFIKCVEHLIETNLTNPSKLAIRGSSAGGLLVGAAWNMRPDLFKVAVADFSFNSSSSGSSCNEWDCNNQSCQDLEFHRHHNQVHISISIINQSYVSLSFQFFCMYNYPKKLGTIIGTKSNTHGCCSSSCSCCC